MILFEELTLLQPLSSNVPYYLTVRMFHVIHFLVGGRLEGKERKYGRKKEGMLDGVGFWMERKEWKERKEWDENGRYAGRCMVVEGKGGMGRGW